MILTPSASLRERRPPLKPHSQHSISDFRNWCYPAGSSRGERVGDVEATAPAWTPWREERKQNFFALSRDEPP